MENSPISEKIIPCINSGRAVGKNDLLPELLKCCDVDLLEYMHDL